MDGPGIAISKQTHKHTVHHLKFCENNIGKHIIMERISL